ncbi:hypothetical protein [[Mycobacterium] wendilense]|uniref:Uroporphyrinogen decarboxylase (URO-D) domain-containing protein n=1 Tax=[Mycobacterium] wendilense TaxID=3064284 RepID=A0ABN9NZQ0_9MYCO|nr:hypothetical protein [Mycolicibacterium sp. MU0050]CAJ1583537.1 hypothetical protein MU0050_002671 [Mycolicibacterium sp. MU0050]
MNGPNPFVPVLDEVAARITRTAPCWRTDPMQWAYCLREAVGLVAPDWVLANYDPSTEVDAITDTASESAAVLDVEVAESPILVSALELTSVLTKLYPRHPVAASVTGPATLSLRLAERFSTPSEQLPDLVADVGDLLGALVADYVTAGANRILVWEPVALDGVFPADRLDDLADAHAPLLRRLDTMGVPAVLCGAERLPERGYRHHAVAGRGLAPAARFGAEPFLELWQELCRGHDGPIITDGPIPGDCDLSLLSAR